MTNGTPCLEIKSICNNTEKAKYYHLGDGKALGGITDLIMANMMKPSFEDIMCQDEIIVYRTFC